MISKPFEVQVKGARVGSGLLDQFSSLFGRADHALFLDCDTLVHERLPLGSPAPAIVVCDSQDLATARRRDVRPEKAPSAIASRLYSRPIPHTGEVLLFKVGIERLEAAWNNLDPIGRRRARHVLTENHRVRLGSDALKANDIVGIRPVDVGFARFQPRPFETHLDCARQLDRSRGGRSRLPGGRSRGLAAARCTVNLVEAKKADEFSEAVRSAYARKTGTSPEIHICHAADGEFMS